MKKSKTQKPLFNRNIFKNKKSGSADFKGLTFKESKKKFNDIDYLLLLDKVAKDIENANPYKSIPADYGNYDSQVVELAHQVAKGKNAGLSDKELYAYIANSIILEE